MTDMDGMQEVREFLIALFKVNFHSLLHNKLSEDGGIIASHL